MFFNKFSITANNSTAKKAADLFKDELELRLPSVAKGETAYFQFIVNDESNSEDFSIEVKENIVIFTARRLRGLIYAYSMFLRKCDYTYSDECIYFDNGVSCSFSPYKKIRGHQLGYRDTNNSCDAWTVAQFRRYILDLMMFGTNTIEGICDGEKQNCLMLFSARDMLLKVAEICDELDVDLSVWHPTYSKESDNDVEEKITDYYKDIKKLDVIFVPGGDPGDMMPADLFKRCKFIKDTACKYHPDVQLWISAQAPHEYSNWGEKFIEELQNEPEFIDGIIYGPNHAMSLEDLRRLTPEKYPLRFYPDVTHCVRCEYPVHFDKDDWHYAYASAFGRESINPRPAEYRHIYKITEDFVVGSVTYSDGVHDDFNKIIWSAMDFQRDVDIFETAVEYAQALIPGINPKKFAQCMFASEKVWESTPDEELISDSVYSTLISLENAKAKDNYRYIMAVFKAECDKLIKMRFNFENQLIKLASHQLKAGNIDKAKEILSQEFPEEYKLLRKKIDNDARKLFSLIGLQLNVEDYHGKSWERGCTLDTIDKPITDRQYILHILNENRFEDLSKILDPHKNESYFSFAYHGFEKSGKQEGEFYMDFQGDTPNNDGTLPMRLIKVYDHYNIKFSFSTENENPKMRITYKRKNFDDSVTDFTIKINGKVFYKGYPYGGEVDEKYEYFYLHKNYTAVLYDIPKELLQNGYCKVEITEPTTGFMISEISIF